MTQGRYRHFRRIQYIVSDIMFHFLNYILLSRKPHEMENSNYQEILWKVRALNCKNVGVNLLIYVFEKIKASKTSKIMFYHETNPKPSVQSVSIRGRIDPNRIFNQN